MALLLLSILSVCCLMIRLQCMHRIIMADFMLWGFFLAAGAGVSLEAKVLTEYVQAEFMYIHRDLITLK